MRLLEQLSLGYSTIPLAIKFIQMLVNEYSSLCKALPSLLLLLQPLVSALGGVGVGWGGWMAGQVSSCVGVVVASSLHVCLLIVCIRTYVCGHACTSVCGYVCGYR